MARLELAACAAATVARYNARRALGARPRTLAEVAERTWVIAPGVDEPAARPFIPDGHLARIQRGCPRLPCPHEVRRLLTAVARETRAYLLRDAFLVDRHVYSGLHKHDLFRGPGNLAAFTHERAGTLDDAVLASCYAGARWFGHFLHDELPLQMLARKLGNAVGHCRPAYRHERAWRSLLELDAPADYGVMHARRLIVIDDIGQNPDKRARYRSLRDRLRSSRARSKPRAPSSARHSREPLLAALDRRPRRSPADPGRPARLALRSADRATAPVRFGQYNA
jgi:hypothetical protein